MELLYSFKSEKGQGLVEYGLIIALLSVVAVGALGGVGSKVSNTFNTANDADVDAKIAQGYIPVATGKELRLVGKGKQNLTFGKDTKWENDYINGLDGKYILVSDIDLSGENFEPIGDVDDPFTGDFDGGGYAIENLTIKSSMVNTGLFGYSEGAFLSNVILNNVDVEGGAQTGALLGRGLGTVVTKSHSSGNVKSYSRVVGGLIGIIGEDSMVSDCSTDGTVYSSGGYTGGLIGTFNRDSSVNRSFSTANVTSDRNYVGGLVGHIWNKSTLSNSYSTGKVRGSNWVGGLVGLPQAHCEIKNSYTVGDTDGTGPIVGGFVSQLESGTVGSSNYYNSDIMKGNSSGSGNLGKKSTSEMMLSSTYEGWDFSTIWQMNDGEYPTLR